MLSPIHPGSGPEPPFPSLPIEFKGQCMNAHRKDSLCRATALRVCVSVYINIAHKKTTPAFWQGVEVDWNNPLSERRRRVCFYTKLNKCSLNKTECLVKCGGTITTAIASRYSRGLDLNKGMHLQWAPLGLSLWEQTQWLSFVGLPTLINWQMWSNELMSLAVLQTLSNGI